MSLWSKLMWLFGVTPKRPAPPVFLVPQPEEEELSRRITEASDSHAAATGEVVNSALNQVQRAEDVKVVIDSLKRRIEEYDNTLKLASGALDLVSRRREHR